MAQWAQDAGIPTDYVDTQRIPRLYINSTCKANKDVKELSQGAQKGQTLQIGNIPKDIKEWRL